MLMTLVLFDAVYLAEIVAAGIRAAKWGRKRVGRDAVAPTCADHWTCVHSHHALLPCLPFSAAPDVPASALASRGAPR